MSGTAQRAPVLIARVSNEQRDFIEGAALGGRVIYVPLEAPPRESVQHVLEVHVDGRSGAALTLMVEPLGPTTREGTPLRLRFPVAVSGPAPRGPAFHASGMHQRHVLRKTPETLQEIELDQGAVAGPSRLAKAGPPPAVGPHGLVGRSLAAGKLVVEAFVGEGGAGAVFRARHRDLQMAVAVKILHESYQHDAAFCLRFHAEALSASRLDHANLTRVLDFGQEPDGLLYIAMEFLDGQTLRDVLVREGALPFARAAQLMIQVCSGLTHAHARSIIHRDIKPENLVLVRGLDDDGRETEIVKVCDFGIAHRTVESSAVFAGTAEYISPEQFAGEVPDVQSDVYACGVVLYELLTGRVPIEGDIPAIVPRVIRGVQDPPSTLMDGIDPRVDRLVLKSLAKDREVRHASVRELRSDLRTLAEEIAVFSSGGYWDDGPASSPTTRPAPPPAAGTPDWLETGTGYLEALTRSEAPHARQSSAPPERAASSPASSPRSSKPDLGARASFGSVPAIETPRSAPPRSALETPPRSSIPSFPPVESASGIIHGSHVSMTPSMPPDADDSAKGIAPFLRQLAETKDPNRLRALTDPLPGRIHELLSLGHRGALWRLASTLEMIARENDPRAEIVRQALEVFKEKDVLAELAMKALDGVEDKDGFASKLIVRAGRRGAHALYGARLKHGVFEARERFVTLLGQIGVAGSPVIRSALEHLEPRLAVPGAIQVVEDILRAVPEAADEGLGQVIARYVKAPQSTLALHATIALPRAWRERARPLVLAQAHHKDDDVAIAAIKRVRELWRVDREALGQLAVLVSGKIGSHTSVRLAAIEALVTVTPDAKAQAQALLAKTLDETQGSTPDVEDMIVMLAATIVAIGGDPAIVAARWKTATTWLRPRLEAVLRRAKA